MQHGFSRSKGGNQHTQPRAVDILNSFHIQDNFLLSLRDQTLHFRTQSIAFLAKDDAAAQRDYGHAVHFAGCHAC
jgi:hypothetical protein